MEQFILGAYVFSLSILFLFGSHGFVMIFYYFKNRDKRPVGRTVMDELPAVTVQLPVYNELYVVERLIDAVCALDYPREKLEIQVLDDSNDETVELVAAAVARKQAEGYDIVQVRRENRVGFKAGALRQGMAVAKGEFIAIFDADFVPRPNFLLDTLKHFTNERVGMVQTRWEHLNNEFSLLTRAQGIALDGHFVIEQQVRNKSGFFINFNGTAGIWRRSCIEDAGNWEDDTLTEDLDLSYRAQLKGWNFVFLNDVTSPAELPSEINALKSQQFRWTKGAIETSKKILPRVWKSKLPLRVKLQSTVHLTNNLVFPFILLTGILNVPLVFIKATGRYETFFAFMSIFVLAFISSFLFYLYSQKDVYPDWKKRIFLFPLFMSGSMGFSVNNTRAVLEGLFNKKSAFIRTPKFRIETEKDTWKNKKYRASTKIPYSVMFEITLAIYCSVGVLASLWFLEIAALPFQLLFFLGFGLVGYLSIRHALSPQGM
ncbi:MAG: glycosyltransferase family 2 protein [Bacteroidota bacterium]|nr:glycosyltransferase family 2 protein [Bacteroidota bacterium]